MTPTCRFLFFLAFTGWMYIGCEPHDLSKTKVLYEEHGHGHHDDGHDHHHEGDKHDDHANGDDHSDDHKAGEHKKGHGKKDAKSAGKKKVKPKEEPRNLGL